MCLWNLFNQTHMSSRRDCMTHKGNDSSPNCACVCVCLLSVEAVYKAEMDASNYSVLYGRETIILFPGCEVDGFAFVFVSSYLYPEPQLVRHTCLCVVLWTFCFGHH